MREFFAVVLAFLIYLAAGLWKRPRSRPEWREYVGCTALLGLAMGVVVAYFLKRVP